MLEMAFPNLDKQQFKRRRIQLIYLFYTLQIQFIFTVDVP